MAEQKRLLITGASGFTGQHACNYFAKAGYRVIAVTRKKMNQNCNIAIEHCELTDKQQVEQLIKKTKPNYLLHLAGQTHVGDSWKDPMYSIEANVLSTMYLLEALRHEQKACNTVIVGSLLQFNPAHMSELPHPYSLSKTMQQLIAQAWEYLFHLHVVMAIPTNLIGPGESKGVCTIFAKKIVEIEKQKIDPILEIHNPMVQRDFLDVRDAVKAYEILLTNGISGEVYEVSSGKIRTLFEIIQLYKELTPVNFKIKSMSSSGNERVISAVPTKLMSIGWQPTIPITTSLHDILHYVRNEYDE